MKFLIIGLGSMGKRRIRNLKALNETEIIGFDPNLERCNEVIEKYNIKAFDNYEICLAEKPDAFVISTPPDLHMKYAKEALKNKIHFFTEASVVQDEMNDVIKTLDVTNVIGLPSCTMRYHPIVKKINELLKTEKIGKTLAFFHHSGQYLPDWHPWEDYRQFYVSKRETGACREIVPFELIWLISTFGKIKNVFADKDKVSDLEADIDDLYNTILEFKNGIKGVLTVDVIARVPIRQLKILTQNGMITADWYQNKVSCFTTQNGWEEFEVSSGEPEKGYIHGEKMYVEEMEHFIKSIKKEIKQNYTFSEDLEILKVLEKIENSSLRGVKENIEN